MEQEYFSQHFLICTSIIFIVMLSLWWLICVPCNWTKDLTDVGYNHLKGKGSGRNSKVNTINRLRRTRIVGDGIPPPYPNGWFGLIESENVRCGQAVHVSALGQNFVIFRTESGVVNILDAYCPHLGANLGVGGIVKGDCIECPFHEWTFNGADGSCTKIPYADSGTIPKQAKLNKWQSRELNDYIFVWHHIDESVVPWKLNEVSEISTGKLMYYGRNEFKINCHVQEIAENGADVAHLNAIHRPIMLSGSDLRHSKPYWATLATHSWNAQWNPPTDSDKSHEAQLKLNHSIKILDKYNFFELKVAAKQIGPGYVELHFNSSFGPFLITQIVTPLEPLLQQVIHRFYFPRYRAVLAKLTVWGESIMFERDAMIWNHKTYTCNPCLVKEDRLIKSYRNWYSQFYAKESKTFVEANKNLSW